MEESFAAWRKQPEYEKAYNALEEDFSLASAMIEARARAGLTQEQLAERRHTTQAVIARLESGRVKPSTRTRRARSNSWRRRRHAAADFIRAGARELNLSLKRPGAMVP